MIGDWSSKDGSIVLYNVDFLDVIGQCKGVDSVIIDPPYGIDYSNSGGFCEANGWNAWRGTAEWDKQRLTKEHIDAILELAVPTTIWGGNYYTDMLPPSAKWLIWDKGQTDFTLADCELAWGSWGGAVRRLMYPRASALQDGKVHPTQKPLALIDWNIKQLPKPPRLLADFTMGSGTTMIAAHRLGINVVGCEKDATIFDVAVTRIEEELGRTPMFPEPEIVQRELW
jgi:hypothetical protein